MLSSALSGLIMSDLQFGTLPTPPQGLNFIAVIQPSLNILLIGTISSSMLVPITIVLFVFSTPPLRRKPIFILNALSLFVGIVQGALIIYGQVSLLSAIMQDYTLSFLLYSTPLCSRGPWPILTLFPFLSYHFSLH